MQKDNANNLNKSKQQGIALIMSLVILLVLTLLAVTSMNTSNLQTLMTGNSQYQMIALNTAEDAIKTAQKEVDDLVNNSTAIANGYYNTTVPLDINNVDWDNDDVATIAATNSKYIVEFLNTQKLNSSSKAWRQDAGIVGDNVSVFRITARTPASRGAMRYVQAIYVTLKSP